jgi:alpha-ketoglutarate-dependent taurine dioxygenase
LFRWGDRLSSERQVEISSWFGQVGTHFDGKMYTVLSNKNEFGRDRLPFHCDYTFTEQPFLGITLHATALPEGSTTPSFVSGVHGWASLPPDRRAQLAGLTLRHREILVGAQGQRNFSFDHPLRLVHPKTGKRTLLRPSFTRAVFMGSTNWRATGGLPSCSRISTRPTISMCTAGSAMT